MWYFGNDFARDVVIFDVDSSSSFHSDNCKSEFLILGEGPICDINNSFGSPKKTFSINFSKRNTKICLSLHYNGDNSYLIVTGKEICKFKADSKNVDFPTQFCLGGIPNKFGHIEKYL